MRHGGQILIDQLEAHGVRRVFEVPGESFLAALDGLYDNRSISTIVCRHEGAAAMMAEATGKLTGRPGVAFATRGPGAANAMSGVYVAQQDATPMILFVGLPQLKLEQQAPFQDLDLAAMYAPIAKWTAVIHDTSRIAEYVARAFHIAMTDRPGPVVLGLPEDVLSADCDATIIRPVAVPNASPSPQEIVEIKSRLEAAERPMLLVGGPGWSTQVKAAVEAFALAHDIPIAAAFRCQDYIDNRHPCYVGHSGFGTDRKLQAGLRAADLILAIGAELGDITTGGYTLVLSPEPTQQLIHVHPSGRWAGGICRADVAVAATASGFAQALAGLRLAPPSNARGRPWARFKRDLRAAYISSLQPKPLPGDINFGDIVRTISNVLPEGGLTTNGAGNYSQWVHRYFEFKDYRSGLAPICGSMGYGLPAAIAAKLEDPSRPVVAFAGDGCLQMSATELGTAVQYGLPIIVIVANNGIFGTIRMHQERKYPGRVMGTTLVNPDFAALARSFGCEGATIRTTAEFEPAFRRALHADVPTVIDLKLDAEAITPVATLTAVRQGQAK